MGGDSFDAIGIEREMARLAAIRAKFVEQESDGGVKSKWTRVMIEKDGGWSPAGEISNKSPRIPYADAMRWILDGLVSAGARFKLARSDVSGKRLDVRQEYVIDSPVALGRALVAPAVIARFSYSKMPPLTVCLGVYFCGDGFASPLVARGGCVETATRYSWDSMRGDGFGAALRGWLDGFGGTVESRGRLADIPLKGAGDAFAFDLIPFCVRKKALGAMERRGAVLARSLPSHNGMRYKPIGAETMRAMGGALIADGGGLSAWDAYHEMARISAGLSTPLRVLRAGRAVDRAFDGMSAERV